MKDGIHGHKESLWNSSNNTLLYDTIHNSIFNIRILEGIRYKI